MLPVFSGTSHKRLSLARVIVASLTIGSAAASTISVNRTSDTVGNDGQCTLREAIIAANTNTASGTMAGECVAGSAAEADTIVFSLPNINELCAITGCVIGLQSALPDISSSMSILGPMIIRPVAGVNIRVFSIHSSGGIVSVLLSDLTIKDGRGSFGGGIENNGGAVTIDHCIVTGNAAVQGTKGGGIDNLSGTVSVFGSAITGNSAQDGGGIRNAGGTVNVTNSTISNNQGSGQGGSISNSGILNITDDAISGNSAGGIGGGIYNFGAGATATVDNSSITGNSASFGGAIQNTQSGTLSITTSTISGNSVTSDGGGIDNLGSTTNVSNSTITGNSARDGGGIRNPGGGPVSVKSSIIALNTGATGAPDASGSFASAGFNLIGKIDGSTGFNAPTDQRRAQRCRSVLASSSCSLTRIVSASMRR